MSTWDAVLASRPVNSTARSVIGQRRCAEASEDMGRQELIELVNRLSRKQRLLKLVLGVKSKAQHANLIAALKGKHYGSGEFRAYGNPRAAVEYKRVGEEMQRLNRRISELNWEHKAERALKYPQWTPEERAAYQAAQKNLTSEAGATGRQLER